jgi:hypothetical protein
MIQRPSNVPLKPEPAAFAITRRGLLFHCHQLIEYNETHFSCDETDQISIKMLPSTKLIIELKFMVWQAAIFFIRGMCTAN